MFNLPTLPTDSLYKFMYIGGLILCIFTMFSLNQSLGIIYKNAEASDSLQTKIATLLKIDSITFKNINKKKYGLSLNELNSENKELSIALKAEQNNLEKLITLSELSYLQKSHNIRQKDQINYSRNTAIISFIVGTLLMGIGGFNWIFKIQFPQDRLLQIQVQLAENELANAKIMHVANTYNRNYIPQKIKKV